MKLINPNRYMSPITTLEGYQLNSKFFKPKLFLTRGQDLFKAN